MAVVEFSEYRPGGRLHRKARIATFVVCALGSIGAVGATKVNLNESSKDYRVVKARTIDIAQDVTVGGLIVAFAGGIAFNSLGKDPKD